jgi:hypothetical protein
LDDSLLEVVLAKASSIWYTAGLNTNVEVPPSSGERYCRGTSSASFSELDTILTLRSDRVLRNTFTADSTFFATTPVG